MVIFIGDIFQSVLRPEFQALAGNFPHFLLSSQVMCGVLVSQWQSLLIYYVVCLSRK